jgi:hypothetical protein
LKPSRHELALCLGCQIDAVIEELFSILVERTIRGVTPEMFSEAISDRTQGRLDLGLAVWLHQYPAGCAL